VREEARKSRKKTYLEVTENAEDTEKRREEPGL
jgi:hypothetical protein